MKICGNFMLHRKDANFKVVKIGNSILISKKSFDDWLDETEKN